MTAHWFMPAKVFSVMLIGAAVALQSTCALWAADAPQEEQAAKPQMPRAVNAADPAVRAILGSQPSSPAQCVQAAMALNTLGEIELARWFLKQAIDANLQQEQLAALAQEFGSGTFLAMASRTQLQPEGRQLGEAVLEAANRRWRDPQLVDSLIRQLSDPAEQKRADALRGLLRAGPAAAGALVDALADPARATDRPVLRGALMHFGDDAVEPLVALLDQSDPALQALAAHMLVLLKADRAALELLAVGYDPAAEPQVQKAALEAFRQLARHAPTALEASRLLCEKAQQYFDGKVPVRGDVLGRVELWRWDAATKKCVMEIFATEDAARYLAARLARKAAAISPGNRQAQLLRLATMFELAAYENQLKPLPEPALLEMAAGKSIEELQAVLAWTMETGHPAAATVAAQAIGMLAGKARAAGTAEATLGQQLIHYGSQPTPLVMALRYPDRRLRITAAETVVRLQPDRPFAGASYLPETLAFFAGYSGVRRVLSAAPSVTLAHDNAAWLVKDGMHVDIATSGRDALQRLLACPDYELVLIDACIDQPGLDHLMQQLRRDPRTADLRVGIVARADHFQAAERTASQYPLTADLVRTHNEADFRHQIARVTTMGQREFVDHQLRQQQALKALELLAQLASQRRSLFDPKQVEPAVLAAMGNPASRQAAIAVAELMPTRQSQVALVELASRLEEPLAARQSAARAFTRSAQRHGILLTSAEIYRQYERYNQSADLDAETQKVLGALLDAIEAPTEHLRTAAAGRTQ